MEPSAHPDAVQLRAILMDPSCLATPLHCIFYKEFGEDIYTWSSETLDLEAEDTWGVRIPQVNLDKLEALIAAIQSHIFYTDWSAFTAVAQVLSGSEDPFDLSDPLLVAEAAWAVVEVGLNDSSPAPWGDELRQYLKVLLREEGFTRPPGPLSFAAWEEVYRGSDTAADMHQQEDANTVHMGVVEEYVEAQALLLFQQLSQLPFVTRELLEKVSLEMD